MIVPWRGLIRAYGRYRSRHQLRRMVNFGFLADALWGCGAFVEDYMLLAGLVANMKPARILEIGTNTGLGAVLLAFAARLYDDSAHVTTIDIDQSKGRSNLHLVKGIESCIDFVEGSTDIILPMFAREGRQFNLIFIDGDHRYEQARKDWENTQTLTATWVLHDTTQFAGLQRLVSEIRALNEYDVFQVLSKIGHRMSPVLMREEFITGMSLVQHRRALDVLPEQAHRDTEGNLLSSHGDHHHLFLG